MQALYAALDAARRAHGLSWIALVAEINKPFAGVTSIPISVGTVRGIAKKSSVTSAVVLQILRWLGRTPESFLSGSGTAPQASEILPEPGPACILRFDTRAMHAALERERLRRGMKWSQVAEEMPGFTESMLTNLAKGPLIGFPRVMVITQWLEQPAATFVRERGR
jgi:hypothetical protein